MEKPISFDVYGKIDSDHREEAVAKLLGANIYTSEIEARKSINAAYRDGKYTILSRGQGWEESYRFMNACNWAKELTLCQEMYYPGGKESYCKEHNLHMVEYLDVMFLDISTKNDKCSNKPINYARIERAPDAKMRRRLS